MGITVIHIPYLLYSLWPYVFRVVYVSSIHCGLKAGKQYTVKNTVCSLLVMTSGNYVVHYHSLLTELLHEL